MEMGDAQSELAGVSSQTIDGRLCLPVQGPSEGRILLIGTMLVSPQRQED